jgi:DNA repair exonuclease SbcCD ATPase subunit
MHIEKILLRDVGPFDDVTIEFPKGTDPQLADVYLLTGPNGTGKSTILYALAAVIGGKPAIAGYDVELGRSLLTTRMRSQNAVVAFRTDDGQTLAASHPERPPKILIIWHSATRSIILSSVSHGTVRHSIT